MSARDVTCEVLLSDSSNRNAVVRASSLSASNGERMRCRNGQFAVAPVAATRQSAAFSVCRQTQKQKNGGVLPRCRYAGKKQVGRLIHLTRGEKVPLDADLARLYGTQTKALNRAVKRNRSRFPPDFMFQLTAEEARILKCQSGTSSSGHGGRRRSLPYAFTEQGVAMLSSVLRSERAVQVNIAIMRAFVTLRRMLAGNEALARKLAELERKIEGHDSSIRTLFDAIRELAAPPAKPRGEIGFHVKEDVVPYRVKRK